jgi:hypothetical protein
MNFTIEEIKELIEDFEWDHNAVGIRLEEKKYQVGDVIADSKHNVDREDEREFPDFNSEEYAALPEFPGVSTWNSSILEELETMIDYHTHCYIVVGDDRSWYDSIDEYVLDENELVIENGRVALVIK